MHQNLHILPGMNSDGFSANIRNNQVSNLYNSEFETQQSFNNLNESWTNQDLSYTYIDHDNQIEVQSLKPSTSLENLNIQSQWINDSYPKANHNFKLDQQQIRSNNSLNGRNVIENVPHSLYQERNFNSAQIPNTLELQSIPVGSNETLSSNHNLMVAVAAANAMTQQEQHNSSMNIGSISKNFISAPSRTVYLGNIPPTLTIRDLLDHVRSGVIEEAKILPEKMCAFISFLDENSSLLFYSDAILKRLNIDGRDIKIGWGNPSPVSSIVASSVATDGATRNIFIGQLNTTDKFKKPVNDFPNDQSYSGNENALNEEVITEEKLRKDLEEYGEIDCIKIIKDKGFAFVHFASILSAIKVVNNLANSNPYYSRRKIFYGKDRCAFITKTQQHNAAQFLGIPPSKANLLQQANADLLSNALLQQAAAAAAIATSAGGSNNLGNRTVYLGNLPANIKIEDICNTIRCGLLQNIKLLSDRHVCFVTFIDPVAAAQFYAMSSIHGFILQKKRCKVGWGKHSGPLSNLLTLAVSNGASRNVYIGNIDYTSDSKRQEPYFTDNNLRRIFSEYGEIEQINFLYFKNCCFINYTNINNAISAIDKMKSIPAFKNLKINFGKDRCGNIAQQRH